MLTASHIDTCVRAISVALGAYTTPEAAQERARNITQALMAGDPDRHSVIAGALLVRRHEIRDFWRAAQDCEVAFIMACQPNNIARMHVLCAHLGHSETEAVKYLQDKGWALPEGVVAA